MSTIFGIIHINSGNKVKKETKIYIDLFNNLTIYPELAPTSDNITLLHIIIYLIFLRAAAVSLLAARAPTAAALLMILSYFPDSEK